MIKRILMLPHIKVHNANALSSPFTIGFPAITAWMGAVHALQRKINASRSGKIEFKASAIISHAIDLQTYKGKGDFVHSIIGTGNPLGKDGKRPSFIEEARCHIDASLLIEYQGIDKTEEDKFVETISNHMNASMKIAGGDIISFSTPQLFKIDDESSSEVFSLLKKLMPGYAVIERRELMKDAMKKGQDAIDAMLDYLVVHNRSEKDAEGIVKWISSRKISGWIVPIATGFQGLTELGQAANQRDPTIPHRFAESIVTLGEFLMLHRIRSLEEILWRYYIDEKNSLYACQQNDSAVNNQQLILGE
ncbi:MAG: type I-F CRISPR-associated protein Csy2 [Candidatus Cloacimonetes bacterium]|nr:type I-F CRISPR-associated protein Csy2 [Candidatus Cloacimonadota bacterium]